MIYSLLFNADIDFRQVSEIETNGLGLCKQLSDLWQVKVIPESWYIWNLGYWYSIRRTRWQRVNGKAKLGWCVVPGKTLTKSSRQSQHIRRDDVSSLVIEQRELSLRQASTLWLCLEMQMSHFVDNKHLIRFIRTLRHLCFIDTHYIKSTHDLTVAVILLPDIMSMNTCLMWVHDFIY